MDIRHFDDDDDGVIGTSWNDGVDEDDEGFDTDDDGEDTDDEDEDEDEI